MNLAKISVLKPVAVTMRILALVLLGAVCFTRLPVDLLPAVTLPTVAVNTLWPNVAPEEMETQVTRVIERAVSSAPNLYQVDSSSTEGQSSVRVTFQWGTDIGQAAVDVLQLVQRAKRSFPTDPTLQEPTVFKFDPSQTPILVYGVSGEPDVVKLRTLLDNQVAPIIESANGVAAVNVTGGESRAVLIEINPDKLRARGLTLREISDRIARENLNLPAGVAKQSDTEFILRSTGFFKSVKEIENVPLTLSGGATIRLGEIARVRDAKPETRIRTRLNGAPAVGILVVRQSGANTIATAEAVQEKLKEANRAFPQLKFSLAYDQSRFIENAVNRVKEDGIIGGALAILILLFFLRSVRSTLVVALSIPISVVSTFALIYLCGFSLNTMSLSGLALAIGLIVDDAVVVLENIFRHIERDKKRPAEAAVSGAQEIFSAVVASTITIMVVFLPLLLIRGQSGQMFTQLALVVIFSIGVSLLDATTVVPMLASRFIREEDVHEPVGNGPLSRFFRWSGRVFERWDNNYQNALKAALKRRWWVVGGALLASASSLLLVPYIGTELMPASDSGDFQLNLKMPVGTSFAKTDEIMLQAEAILMSDPDVATVFSAAGTNLSVRGASSAAISNAGAALVKLRDDRTRSTQDVIGDLRKKINGLAGAKPRLVQFDLVTQTLTGGNQNVEVNIFGEDLEELARLGKETIGATRDVTGFENVDVNWQDSTPEVQWRIDRQKAARLGLSFQDVADTIGASTNGFLTSYYQQNGFQYPIYVILPESERKTPNSLLGLPLRPAPIATTTPTLGRGTLTGATIELRQVAKPVYETGPSEITRLNRQRYIAVSGTPESRSTSEIQEDISKRMESVKLPAGYRWDWGTNLKRRAQEFSGLNLAVFLAIALIYMLLASQFESFIHPFTILCSVPLSILGVILALFLSGRAFGLTAFIGLLLLVGIVVKNGILLIDYTNLLRTRGMDRDTAVVTASPTRLRPILMTSLAAGFGMLPLALGLGEGSETQAPLATAVIGGLLTSTALTLFVVPCVYTLFDDLARKLRRNPRDLSEPTLIEPSIESLERQPVPAERDR